MTTNYARPDDLDAFARGGQSIDANLQDSAQRLLAAYEAFRSACQWGVLDADSLLNGMDPQFIAYNEDDARWVATIAAAFRHADAGRGLPDAAIAAILKRAGLSDVRGSVTFDAPVAYGFPPTSGYTDDPVNTGTGNFVELESDLPFAGLLDTLRVERTYNSRSDRSGPFGRGWSSWATARLRATDAGAEFEGPDGRRALFARTDEGYERVSGIDALVEVRGDGDGDGGLALAWFGGGRWEFADDGLPASVTRGPGTAVALGHDRDERLVELVHERGKRVDLEWDGDRIVAAACSDGRRVDYRYDASRDLVEVLRSGAARRYDLDDAGRIVSVTDADGVVEVVNVYDAEGRVIEQLSPFGRRTHVAYLPGRVTVTSDDEDGPPNTYVHDQAGRVIEIIDGEGEQVSYDYDRWGNLVELTERGGVITAQRFDERSRVIHRSLPTGAQLTFAYDDADRVVEVAASTGAVTRMTYAGDERSPVQITDPEGGVSRMTVEGGLVRELVDPDGVVVRFAFDEDGNVASTTDADGNVARVERDAAGRVTAAITPLGRRTTFEYDDRGLPAQRRDPAGSVWRFEHTAAGRLAAVTDPTGARRETRYGDHGLPEATVDPLGHVTAQRYDVFGNVAGVIAPDGAAWQYGYDALMRLTTIEDPAGAIWRREYDADGNHVASVDPVGTRCSAQIDSAGRVKALDDGLTSSAFEFDELGRAIAQTRPDGTQARCTYDRCGRRVEIVDQLGGVTRTTYSAGGKPLRAVSPSGRVDTAEYDRCGRLAARIDGAGRRWEYRYDADGAVAEIAWPDGGSSRYAYDDAGRLAESSEPGRGVTSFEYDAAGRTTAITDRDAGRRAFAYDAAGRIANATDANGGVTSYAYDERGLMIATVDPLGATTTFAYDAVRRVVAETDPLGRTSTIVYDAAGRVVERVDGSGRTTRRTYDASGRLSSLATADAEPTTIERDALGRAVSIAEPGSFVNELRWDRAGRLVERRRDDAAMRWRYTEDGERAALVHPDGSEKTYSYDAGGYLTGQRHPGLGAIELERDEAGRLVGATGDGMRAHWRYERGDLAEYRFEAAGAIRTAQLARDGVGRVVEAIVDGAAQRFAYDPAGELVSAGTPGGAFAFHYDASGRLVGERSPDGEATYAYDAAGQLLARRRDGDVTAFEYDGAGRRVRETRGEHQRSWRWDDLGRLAEVRTSGGGGDERSTTVAVDALGELAEAGGTPLMWDTAGAMSPLAWIGDSAVVGHGSPWALAGADAAQWLAPDWQGTIGDQPRDPWGAPTGAGPPGAAAGVGYRGEVEFDGETWLRNRVYEPATRAFLRPDPVPPVPGGAAAANPYHYAAGNPIGLSDPLGLHPVSDADLSKIRDRMDRNIFERGADVLKDNWQYIAAGAMIIGGTALMFTGVGGPAGIALMAASGGLIAAGGSAAIQKYTTGDVNWGKVAVDGAIGAVTAGAIGGAVTFGPKLIAASLLERGAAPALSEGLGPETETFYRGMSQAELAGLKDSGGLSIQGTENFVTQDRAYVQQLADRWPEKYPNIVQFEMQAGTKDALISAGARSDGNLLIEHGLGDLPKIDTFPKRFPDIVHVKAEGNAINYGLRKGTVDIFNSRISSFGVP